MILVVIESPYAGDTVKHLSYLRAAMADCLARGESPYASHALLTQPGVLCDDVPAERARGIEAGFAWRSVADVTAVYVDLGITPGMAKGIEHATQHGRPVEFRTLPAWTPPVAAEPRGVLEVARDERLVLAEARAEGLAVALRDAMAIIDELGGYLPTEKMIRLRVARAALMGAL